MQTPWSEVVGAIAFFAFIIAMTFLAGFFMGRDSMQYDSLLRPEPEPFIRQYRYDASELILPPLRLKPIYDPTAPSA